MDDPDIDIPPYASARARSRKIDPETKLMAIIAGGLGIGVIALAMIWSGVHTGLGPPPIIKPPAGPMRTKPTNPGGLQVPGAHERIMSGGVAAGPPQLAPASQQPDFSKLDREAAASQPAPAHTAPPAAPAPAPPPAAVASLPLPPPGQPSQPAALAPLPAAAIAALPPMTAPTQVTTSGAYAVQLAALNSMPKADQAWQTLVARVPDILSTEKPVVVPGVVHGRTFYRLRLDGFATAAAATSFCARLKSRGVTCYIPK